MEGLHGVMSNAVNFGLIRGIKLVSPNIALSHLFYADDVVITFKWNSGDLQNIIRVLNVFRLALGLKINIHKYNIYGIGVSNDEVSSTASRTGCAAGSFPFTYRGILIGSNMNLTSQDAKSLAWVKWSNVLPSFEKGGLNIGSLKAFNLDLFQKWRWRLFSSLNAHWVKVIKALHGQEGGLDHQGCNFNDT
ncbi:hypothetical protein Tco_1208108 [Tanacetum coccineum]